MTQSGRSMFYFGIYVVCTGLLFIIIPERFISLTHLPAMPSGWARVIGLLALVIGSYDIYCGHANIRSFIKASVYVRIVFTIGTIMLFVFEQMPVPVILLGGVDALGAFWTVMALKSEASKKNDFYKI